MSFSLPFLMFFMFGATKNSDNSLLLVISTLGIIKGANLLKGPIKL